MNQPNTVHQLENILREHGIPIETWGQGKAKSVTQLLQEILDKESVLFIEDGKLVRMTSVACIDVLFQEAQKPLKLVEQKQVLADGRTRERKLETSVNEKLIADEKPIDGARRGIIEELKLENPFCLWPMGVKEETIESPSYPSLIGRFKRHFFSMRMPVDQFKADGYIEENDKGARTYFVWKEIE